MRVWKNSVASRNTKKKSASATKSSCLFLFESVMFPPSGFRPQPGISPVLRYLILLDPGVATRGCRHKVT